MFNHAIEQIRCSKYDCTLFFIIFVQDLSLSLTTRVSKVLFLSCYPRPDINQNAYRSIWRNINSYKGCSYSQVIVNLDESINYSPSEWNVYRNKTSNCKYDSQKYFYLMHLMLILLWINWFWNHWIEWFLILKIVASKKLILRNMVLHYQIIVENKYFLLIDWITSTTFS